MSLGWAGELAPSGGQEALTALISQRMQMARDAEAVRAHQADEQIRRDELRDRSADRDLVLGTNLGKSQVLGNDVTDIAPTLYGGGQGPNMSAPAYAQMPVPAPPPSLADPLQDQNAPLPDGGVTQGGPYRANAPSLDSVAPTKRITWLGTPQEREAKQKQDTAAAFIRSLPPNSQEAQDAAYQQAMGHPRPATAKGRTAVDIGPDIQTTTTGKRYLDMSAYGVSERAAAREAANDLTDVVTIGKEEASTLHDIDRVRLDQDALLGDIEAKLPKTPAERAKTALGTTMDRLLQTDEDKAAFGAWRATAISTLRAMAGSKGLRINQAEIKLALENDIPTIYDTVAVAQKKIATVKKVMANAENAILVRDRSTLVPPAAGATPPPATAGTPPALPPRSQRVTGKTEADIPGIGHSVWDGNGWKPMPRPNAAAPAPAGVADVPPAPVPPVPAPAPAPPSPAPPPVAAAAPPPWEGPQEPAGPQQPPALPLTGTLRPLDANRLPETGALAAPAPRQRGNSLSPAGAAALKTREGGFYGEPYQDAGTGLAIGYGMHTYKDQPVTPDLRITQQEGDAEFDRQIKATYGRIVDRALQVPVSQAQYDALVSMSWNLPAQAKHVIDKLNRGEKLTAADFQRSATVKGVANKGLQQRREAEAEAFTKGTP